MPGKLHNQLVFGHLLVKFLIIVDRISATISFIETVIISLKICIQNKTKQISLSKLDKIEQN